MSSRSWPEVEIVAVGNELLTGDTLDTNGRFLTRAVEPLGLAPRFKHVAGDREEDVILVLRDAASRADVVFVTGGLGPTEDDLTRKSVARAFDRRLIFHAELVPPIRDYFARTGQEMPPDNERQALLPSGAKPIPNSLGTAPGFILEDGRTSVIVLPGVPREMRAMYEASVHPYLASRFGGGDTWDARTVRTTGVPESKVNELLGGLLDLSRNPQVGLTASDLGVDLRIRARAASRDAARAMIDALVGEARARLGPAIYSETGEGLEQVVGRLLAERRKTLAIAESCTGGLISERITSISGSSAYFDRGIVTYSNESKEAMLDVPRSVLIAHGAVSPETARAMAEGIRRSAGTDFGLSVTGIAGPTGGTAGKPVGLVYMALAVRDGETRVEEHRFPGDREMVRARSAQAALDLLRLYLTGC